MCGHLECYYYLNRDCNACPECIDSRVAVIQVSILEEEITVRKLKGVKYERNITGRTHSKSTQENLKGRGNKTGKIQSRSTKERGWK
jgi:hypothetical protein